MQIKDTSNSFDFKEFGTNWQNKNHLKRKINLRWSISLLISNIIILSICNQTHKSPLEKITIASVPKGYSRLILPIKVFIPLNIGGNLKSIPIGLYSPNKRLLIAKAFFLPKQKKAKSSKTPLYPVDIPSEKLSLLLPYLDSYLLAYPTRPQTAKNEYEISL